MTSDRGRIGSSTVFIGNTQRDLGIIPYPKRWPAKCGRRGGEMLPSQRPWTKDVNGRPRWVHRNCNNPNNLPPKKPISRVMYACERCGVPVGRERWETGRHYCMSSACIAGSGR